LQRPLVRTPIVKAQVDDYGPSLPQRRALRFEFSKQFAIGIAAGLVRFEIGKADEEQPRARFL